jgi:hypothetical protein
MVKWEVLTSMFLPDIRVHEHFFLKVLKNLSAHRDFTPATGCTGSNKCYSSRKRTRIDTTRLRKKDEKRNYPSSSHRDRLR